MRLWQAFVFQALSKKYDIAVWDQVSKLFEQSGKCVILLCEAGMDRDSQRVGGLLTQIADIEKRAYTLSER